MMMLMMQQNQQLHQQNMQMLMGQAPPNQSMSGGSIFRETREVLLPLPESGSWELSTTHI